MRARQQAVSAATVELVAAERCPASPSQPLSRALAALLACAALSVGLLAASPAQAQTPAGTLWQMRFAGHLSGSPAAGTQLARLDARAARSGLLATQSLSARRIAPVAPAGGSAKIEGVITAAETSEPVEGIQVCAYTSDEKVEECTESGLMGGEGGYQISGLPPGQYYVEFAPAETGHDYVTQYYNGKLNEDEAELVTLGSKEEEVVKEVNAALIKGADIEGKVVSANTKAPLAEMFVCALDSAETDSIESVRCTLTGASGNYTLIGLAAGSYVVQFGSIEPEYGLQYYNGKLRFAEAEPIELLAPGSVASGIDADLHPVPAAIDEPVIVGGVPVQGIPLSFIPGSWSNGPTTLTDEWGRCNAAGGSCFTIAEGPNYTPTALDIGHRLRIREKATNEFGEGKESFSAPTAIVLALSHKGTESTPPPSGGSPAGPTPVTVPAPVGTIGVGGGSGVLASKTTVPSTAQLKSLLLSLLAPRGAAAKAAALRKRRSYTVSFVSLAAGKLSVLWFALPKGSRSAHAKPALVASGSVSTKAGAATKLKITLTAFGRSLLAHAGRSTVTAKGVLAPSGQPPLRATRSFTLEH